MTLGKHPLSLHAFSTVHFFERFSYYGILSLLVLYLSSKLNFSDARSYAILGVYGTLTYATPLIGGYIADRFIGFYAALWLGLSFIFLGHLSILLTQYSSFGEMGLFLGLGCVVTGSGFYKSNMNALIGNLYKKEDVLKDAAYTIFYVYQNAGSFVAPLLCGYIGLNEAIFLQQCHCWLNPKFNKNIIDGKYWVHKTLQQWGEEFSFWGEKTIRRVISNLENLKISIHRTYYVLVTQTLIFS